MDLEQSFMPLVIAFAWISGLLLVGVLLRAKVGFLQRFLFPACIIGGILGFGLRSGGLIRIDPDVFALIAFHLFSLGFLSIGLTGGDERPGGKKELFKGSIWMGLVWTAALCIQSLLGAGIVMGTSGSMYPGLGFLVGQGFAQGPGQALAIGGVWEKSFQIQDAMSVGLTFAAVGFFVAALVGVPLANWGIRKGYATNAPTRLPQDFLSGIMSADQNLSAGRQTTHGANIDTVAFHVGLMGFTYGLGYLFCSFLKNHVFSGPFAQLTFGFIFFWGLIVAILVRFVLIRVKAGRLLDNNIQRRVTGTSVDFMIVATMMAIKVETVWKYIVPISLIVVAATLVTLVMLLYFGRRSGAYEFERTLALFGYATGTGATGLLLLRIVDPEFKTPVALEIGFMNLVCLFTSTHVLFLVGIVPSPKSLGLMAMMGVYAVTALVCVALLKVFRVWGRPKF
jgi:ESS family glutamate:Na+ symporter